MHGLDNLDAPDCHRDCELAGVLKRLLKRLGTATGSASMHGLDNLDVPDCHRDCEHAGVLKRLGTATVSGMTESS